MDTWPCHWLQRPDNRYLIQVKIGAVEKMLRLPSDSNTKYANNETAYYSHQVLLAVLCEELALLAKVDGTIGERQVVVGMVVIMKFGTIAGLKTSPCAVTTRRWSTFCEVDHLPRRHWRTTLS